jgi:PncC family amidohydrolase
MKTPLEVSVGTTMRAKGLTLAVAESSTGGLIAHLVTSAPGSSQYFLGGVVSYADTVKQVVLGVRGETLAQHGAVSRQCAMEMARGVREALGAQVGVAVTGIAGPGGGTAEKPVGMTWVAVITPTGERAERYEWSGDRAENKNSSAEAALKLLLDELEERA